MKVVLTCGHPQSGYRLVHEALAAAGLAAAQPSRREAFSADKLHESIFKAHGLDPAGADARAPLSPGRVWQEVAVDLFLGNLTQETWGWADARSAWLLEFWKELDTQIRFVLVYCAPEACVGQALRDGAAAPENAGDALSSWTAWNDEMLRFYHRNPQRCLLVNLAAALSAPADLVKMAAATLGLALGPLPKGHRVDGVEHSWIASHLARPLVAAFPEAAALHQELESSADVGGAAVPPAQDETRQAWAEFAHLLAARAQAEATAQAAKTEAAAQAAKAESAAAATDAAREKAVAASAQPARQEKPQAPSLEPQVKSLQARNGELLEQNELLLAQMHQVQDELERYFIKYQDLATKEEQEADEIALQARFWRDNAPAQVRLDLRRPFAGANWYPPEPDGSWAGPDLASTLRMPPLPPGAYRVEIEVPDAMEPGILSGMQLALNDAPLAISGDLDRLPARVAAEFSTQSIRQGPLWEFTLRFPKVASPVDRGGEDQRNMAIRVRSFTVAQVNAAAAPGGAQPLHARFWREHQPAEITLDLRREVEGANWYAAEPDGRWAGPGLESALRMPALRAGDYEVQLDVVDVMEPGILTGMELTVNGAPVAIDRTWIGCPAIVHGRISTRDIPEGAAWDFRLRFPRVVSPAQSGADDARHLAIRLRSLKLIAVEPEGAP